MEAMEYGDWSVKEREAMGYGNLVRENNFF
jgi:hypothetical protein